MIQQTSLLAYESIQEELATSQMKVRDVLLILNQTVGGATDQELAKALGWSINRVTPRRGELYKKGVVRQGHARRCRVTGGLASEWWII